MWGEDSHVVCGQFGEANGQCSLLALCRHRLVIGQGKQAAKCIGQYTALLLLRLHVAERTKEPSIFVDTIFTVFV